LCHLYAFDHSCGFSTTKIQPFSTILAFISHQCFKNQIKLAQPVGPKIGPSTGLDSLLKAMSIEPEENTKKKNPV
jgi:hypothetical protein